MNRKQLLPLLLLILAVTGCRYRQWRDHRYLALSQQGNQQQQFQTLRTTPVPPAPQADDDARPQLPADGEVEGAHPVALHEAIEIALAQPSITRVSRGSAVTTGLTTFYDVEIAEENTRAALAEFDATVESEMYTDAFRNPPDSFFAAGVDKPEQRDEAAITAGLTKPLLRGGELSAKYNPSPGYLFINDPTTSGFNPRFVSELEFGYFQPILRDAGRQVNIAPIQVAQLEVEQSSWEFKRSLIETVRSVVDAYWDLYAARVAVDEYEDVIPVLEEVVRIQEESFKANLVIQADVAKARGQLYDYQQDLLGFQLIAIQEELRLRNLLKLPPTGGGKLLPITQPTKLRIRTYPSQAYETALDNRPEIARERLNVSIRRLEYLVAENQRRPNLNFAALYRLNGLGQDLGNALNQMIEAEFTDLQLGLELEAPVGMRQKRAEARQARFRLVRDQRLLEQDMFSVSHEVAEAVQRIDFAYREYEQAKLRLDAAIEWTKGARLRYLNPAPDSGDANWMLQNLNDYLRALRFQTDAAIDVAATLNDYNLELVRYEEVKGTLLEFFAVQYLADPCRQAAKLTGAHRQPPVFVTPIEDPQWTPIRDQIVPMIEDARLPAVEVPIQRIEELVTPQPDASEPFTPAETLPVPRE